MKNLKMIQESSLKEINFKLPIPPSVNQAYGMRVQYMGGRAIPQRYLTQTAKQYKEYVSKTCKRIMKENNIDFLVENKNEFIHMEFVFYFDKKRKDADNTFKLLFDGMVQSKMLLDDDVILYEVKNIFIDKNDPRVEVKIRKSEKKGIFNSEDELNIFLESNCHDCKRYKRNCSNLRKALENRIEPQINKNENICYEKKS